MNPNGGKIVNKTKKDRLLAGSMSIMVAASSLMPAAAVHAEDTQLSRMITPVMISEIVADTHQSDQVTASGTDAFEYIELYNTSDRDIEMDDLLIRNVNGSTLTDWEIPSGTVIKAGQTLVVWVTNAESAQITEADFRAYYGIDDSVQIVKTVDSVNGFSNSGERSMQVIVRDSEQVISSITYNDGSEKAQTKKGIKFAYQDGQVQEVTLSYDEDPTPGTLEDTQRPAGIYQVSEAGNDALSLNAETTFRKGSSYVVRATVDTDSVMLEAEALIDGRSYPLTYEDGSFTAAIPAADIAQLDSFELQVRLSDGVNTFMSEPMRVTAQEGSDPLAYDSPLLITELVPNTANVDGSDAYEFFEIYNASDETIDLRQYHFIYVNGTRETEWQLADDIQLEAGKVLTVWVRNDAVENAQLSVDDFNAAYGTDLQEGVSLTTVRSDGLSNSGSRGMKIESDSGLTLCAVSYTAADSNGGSINQDEGISYRYETSQGSVHYDGTPTPGTLDELQVPGHYAAPAVIEDPFLTIDAPSSFSALTDYEITMSETNLERVLSASITLMQGEEAIRTISMRYEDGVLKGTIPYSDVREMDTVSYVVNITDGVNTASYTASNIPVQDDSVDASLAPALVVSEVIPDTSNMNGADAYEFIEIYNNSNLDINLKDYKLYYHYPDSGSDSVWWESDEDKILRSHETLVFWIKNGGNASLTREDFNAKWGVELTADQLIEISCDGMANGSARGVKIASNVGDVLDYVTYNMDGVDNTNTDRSIVYQNRYEDGFASVIADDAHTPTPGSVEGVLRPVYAAQLPQDVSDAVLTDETPDSFTADSELRFALEAVSTDTSIKTVSLYVRDDLSDDYLTYRLQRNGGDVFSYTLPAIDLFGKTSYTYYFEVSDGYRTYTTDVRTILNTEAPQQGDRLNVADGDLLSGNVQIIGTGNDLRIDGEEVSADAVASISGSAKLAFDASQTDVFFKNAVSIGDDLIGVFNEGTYDSWVTYDYDIDARYFDAQSGQLTVAFHAGNKANALEHDIENNDDFVLKNIRMILPDGTSLRPVSYAGVRGIGAIEHTAENWHPQDPQPLEDYAPETEISMGDGTSKTEILYVTFAIPQDSFNALRYTLDTTALTDGAHTISSASASATVTVDNTAPQITANIEEGAQIRNTRIEASAQDAISEHVTLQAVLDGQIISLPYAVSSTTLDPGTHTLVLTASDEAGNTATQTITFTTPRENADAEVVQPGADTTVTSDPTFSVTVNDPTEDVMNVTFKKGERHTLDDGSIQMAEGVAQTSGTSDPVFDAASGSGFPYQTFDITLSEAAKASDTVKIDWSGASNNAKTFLYARNIHTGAWDQLDTQIEADGETMKLSAEITLENYLSDGKVSVMVQNGEGYTPPQYAAQNARITTSNENDTPREDYDFTFVVESDTQYYNEDYEGNPEQDVDGNYQYQLDIHNWVLANRERMNIQYMFHNGDIIDDEHLIPEWENADAAYRMLDEAGLPYGVLAGNHDVGHLNDDYTNFWRYFGEQRYSSNPWYGGSYQNNRGHYDLITVGGIDFIMLYMGWEIGDEQIEWMNDVLAQYPERKAILNFHEYLLASGGMGEQPQRIYDEVVATNPNVCMVLSGHYHNAQTRIDEFDDDGDGVNDRKVYQMLFDYQGLSQGGMGYIRLMHFDLEGQRIIVRTYSPSLDDYDAKDETGIGDVAGINGEETFEIPFSDLGIVPQNKELRTDSLKVNVYGDEVIGSVSGVNSGETASFTMENALNGTFGWYAEITDENGGLTRTDVQNVTIAKDETPTITVPQDAQIALGDSFDPMQGVSAHDYAGRDITERISVTGSVDTSAAGTYTLTYTVSDEEGNSATAVRVITVVDEGEDPVQPEQPSDGTDADDPTHRPDQGNTGVPAQQGTLFAGMAIAAAAAFLALMRRRISTLLRK